MDNMSTNKPNTLMTHEACESRLRSVVRSFMHPYPGYWVAIGIMPGLPANLVQELNVGTVGQALPSYNLRGFHENNQLYFPSGDNISIPIAVNAV